MYYHVQYCTTLGICLSDLVWELGLVFCKFCDGKYGSPT
jgi:hypothetical protein